MKNILFVCLLLGFGAAQAEVVRKLDIRISNHGGQGPQENFRALVYINGVFSRNYIVTPGTGRAGRGYSETPEGIFHPKKLKVMHNSSQSDSSLFWDGDPMPHTIFFKDGFALHGSYGTVDGRRGSHGCIRLLPDDARELFAFAQEAVSSGGLKAVTIHIQGTKSR
jgi:hypothetical protein